MGDVCDVELVSGTYPWINRCYLDVVNRQLVGRNRGADDGVWPKSEGIKRSWKKRVPIDRNGLVRVVGQNRIGDDVFNGKNTVQSVVRAICPKPAMAMPCTETFPGFLCPCPGGGVVIVARLLPES